MLCLLKCGRMKIFYMLKCGRMHFSSAFQVPILRWIKLFIRPHYNFLSVSILVNKRKSLTKQFFHPHLHFRRIIRPFAFQVQYTHLQKSFIQLFLRSCNVSTLTHAHPRSNPFMHNCAIFLIYFKIMFISVLLNLFCLLLRKKKYNAKLFE